MCEILGITSKDDIEINNYLKIFYSHSNNHPHGWGLAVMDGNEIMLEKEPLQASKSYYLRQRLSQPLKVKTAFAHIRYATIGNVDYQNCHPYTKKDNCKRRWTLIHNGTIFDYPSLNRYITWQTGETDSERILLHIVEKMNIQQTNYRRPLTPEERFCLLNELVTKMSKNNKLNMLLFDGEYMYVHTNCKNSLYFLEQEGTTIFSTTPLTDDYWKPVPFTTLLSYKDGRLIYEGTTHNNEYIENEENLKYLYQIFSDL